MKKKEHIQPEAEQKNTNKTTENKENTHKQENSDDKKQDILMPDYLAQSSEEVLSGPEADSDKFVSEVKLVEEKLADMQDKYIRLSAEFDNYRKRTLREKMDLSKYAGENLLLNIIPLIDDFERALKVMDTTADRASMKNGIDLIYSKFKEFLKQNGITEIESLNSNFNVDLHEAVGKVQVQDADKKGKVVEVILKGYYLQDKVLRFPKVIVGE